MPASSARSARPSAFPRPASHDPEGRGGARTKGSGRALSAPADPAAPPGSVHLADRPVLRSAQCTDVRVNQVAIDRPLRNVRAGDPVTSSIVGVTGSWFVTNPAWASRMPSATDGGQPSTSISCRLAAREDLLPPQRAADRRRWCAAARPGSAVGSAHGYFPPPHGPRRSARGPPRRRCPARTGSARRQPAPARGGRCSHHSSRLAPPPCTAPSQRAIVARTAMSVDARSSRVGWRVAPPIGTPPSSRSRARS
jgi:hypothetical protein